MHYEFNLVCTAARASKSAAQIGLQSLDLTRWTVRDTLTGHILITTL